MNRDIIKVYEIDNLIKIGNKTRVKIDGKREEVFKGMALLVMALAEQANTANENILMLISSMIKDVEGKINE